MAAVAAIAGTASTAGHAGRRGGFSISVSAPTAIPTPLIHHRRIRPRTGTVKGRWRRGGAVFVGRPVCRGHVEAGGRVGRTRFVAVACPLPGVLY